jgi:hypothetical protein
MVFIWGSRLFGKIDQVGPNVHVATKFWHLYYIPLIPRESWVVTEKTDDGWRGFRLKSLHWKSVLVGWLRAACVLGALFCLHSVLATTGAADDNLRWAIVGTFGVACFAALVASYKLTRANEEQIVALGRLSGMSDDEILGHLGHAPVSIRGAAPTTPTGA